jgi:hypothetical protein
MSDADVPRIISALAEKAANGSLRCVGCSSLLDIGGLRM